MRKQSLRIRCLFWVALTAASLPPAALANDVLRILDSAAAPGSVARVPVYVRDVAGTALNANGTPIRAIAFRATFSRPELVKGCRSTQVPECEMTFTPAGVLEGLTPLTQSVSTGASSIAVSRVYPSTTTIPFTLGKSPGDLIGYIELQLVTSIASGTDIIFTIDSSPDETSLANGATKETVGNGLVVAGGSLFVANCPTAPTPQTVTIGWSGACASPTANCPLNGAITFTATGLGYELQACDVVTWSFGDGSTDSGHSATHTFPTAGVYTVTMTVANPAGTATVSKQFTIQSATPPTPIPPPSGGCPKPTDLNTFFSWTGDSCQSPSNSCAISSPIRFIPQVFGYSVSCGTHTYSWNFGDGTTTNASSPTKIYTTTGEYDVRMTVTNSAGSITITSRLKLSSGTVPSPPSCSCAARVPRGGPVGMPLTFEPRVTDCTPSQNRWEFGDGSVDQSSLGTVLHAFGAQGTYTWRLTSTSPAAGSCSVSGTIVIDGPHKRRRSAP